MWLATCPCRRDIPVGERPVTLNPVVECDRPECGGPRYEGYRIAHRWIPPLPGFIPGPNVVVTNIEGYLRPSDYGTQIFDRAQPNPGIRRSRSPRLSPPREQWPPQHRERDTLRRQPQDWQEDIERQEPIVGGRGYRSTQLYEEPQQTQPDRSTPWYEQPPLYEQPPQPRLRDTRRQVPPDWQPGDPMPPAYSGPPQAAMPPTGPRRPLSTELDAPGQRQHDFIERVRLEEGRSLPEAQWHTQERIRRVWRDEMQLKRGPNWRGPRRR